ncbi:MAG: ABC-F family ATP-binding cassette domain-containing protein [Qingshengfaniella sp.]
MAQAPLLQLSGISLTFGGTPVFDGLDLIVQPGDRAALVGRNGSGKSTLMKVMAGLVEPDHGLRTLAPQVSVGYMEQDPDLSGHDTLGGFAAAGLDPADAYLVDMAAEGLKLRLDTDVAAASGGERRRAALVRLLAQAPDLLLLDEPTNHLDIAAIEWLEGHLAATRAACVVISHDRAFLTALTRQTLWLDRSEMRRLPEGFGAFEDWRDRTWAEEDARLHKMDRKIKAEARWAVEGISARRKRNMGRVRALRDLRGERAALIRRQGTADLSLAEAPRSGRRVIDARDITLRFGAREILKPFSIRLMRGDRVAVVGPNGAGKTSLLKILTGQIAPDSGTVELGANVEMAVFDQNRAQLDPDATLWESLTGDPATRVSGRADQVMVRGQPRHVVSYLKDFLFDEQQARAPVRALSGGEKARLLLARIMARESNLLVLDEPTNDLDIETLDLLQDVLGAYDGTVLLVSHDRDFIDRIAQVTVAMEGDGRAIAYAGGWTDYLAQRGPRQVEEGPVRGTKPAPSGDPAPQGVPAAAQDRAGLSFTEKRRLDELPARIARIEAEIAKLETYLSDPDLFRTAPVKFAKATEALAERQTALAVAEEDWLDLAEKAEATG